MGRKLDKANAKVAAAEQTVAEWQTRADQLAADLVEVERSVGADALASGDIESAAGRVSQLREQEATARATVAAAEAARDEAQRQRLLGQATELRNEAERLDREANKHAAKTAELLAQLKAHEGGDYAPLEPPGGSIASGLHYWTPRSEQLRLSADSARRKSAEAEHRAENLARGPEMPMPEPARA